MHILFVCNEYPPAPYGGIGIFVKTLSASLVKNGWRVTVVGYNTLIDEDTVWEENGIKVYWFKKRVCFVKNKILQELYVRYYLTFRVHKIVKQVNPDVVESYDWSGPLLYKRFSAPLVLRMHGAHSAHAFNEKKRRSKFLYILEWLQFYLANSFVAVSKHMGETTLRSFSLQKPFKVVYNPIDVNVFKPVQAIQKDKNILLYVGRIHERKGILELLNTFNLVAERNASIILKLAGDGNDSYIEELRSYITDKAQGRVHFLGKIPHNELTHLYNSAAVTVFPSRAEAFGITIAESMACGIAPIVTNRASGPEIIQHGVSGWLVDVYDEPAFCNTIIQAFGDGIKRKAMGLAAHEVASQKYALSVVTEQNMLLYKKVAKK